MTRRTQQLRRAATHHPHHPHQSRRRGFTLLELLVVLVILAITAAAAVPAFLSDARATPELTMATALASALTQARAAARESGAPVTIVVSPSDGRYWLTTRDSSAVGVLPLNGAVQLIGPNTDRFECRFSPTGPASPLVITVHGARDIAVRVDGWSGDVTIGDGHAS